MQITFSLLKSPNYPPQPGGRDTSWIGEKMLTANVIKAAISSETYLVRQISGLGKRRDFCCADTPAARATQKHSHRRTPTYFFKPQHLKLSSLSPPATGNVFLLRGGLSGVVHWSQPSVINCHNASKLTNGLCVKEGPLIYWPPLVDPQPIISIIREAFMSGHPLPLTLDFSVSPFTDSLEVAEKPLWVSFQHTWRRHTLLQPHKGACSIRTHTQCMLLDTLTSSPLSRSRRRDPYCNGSCDAGYRNVYARLTQTRTHARTHTHTHSCTHSLSLPVKYI